MPDPQRSQDHIAAESPGKPQLPRLIIGEDHDSGQFQLLSYGGTATKSTLTLDDWKAIDWVPDNFSEIVEHKASDLTTKTTDQQGPTFKKKVKRLGTWVKRSGQKLIVQLQKLNSEKETEISEIYLGGYQTHGLTGSPIPKLPTTEPLSINYLEDQGELARRFPSIRSKISTFQELPNTSRIELPVSPVRSELPTVDDLYDLDRNDMETAGQSSVASVDETGVEEPFVSMAKPAFQKRSSPFDPEADMSRTQSINSGLSSAATAVGSISPDSSITTTRALARGLSILGSVRYRCSLNQDGHTPRPVDIAKKTGDVPIQIDTQDRPQITASGMGTENLPNSSERQLDLLLLPKQNVTSPKLENQKSQRNKVVETCGHVAFTQMTYGVTSTDSYYQQDLHIMKVQPQMTPHKAQEYELADMSLQRLEELIASCVEKAVCKQSTNGAKTAYNYNEPTKPTGASRLSGLKDSSCDNESDVLDINTERQGQSSTFSAKIDATSSPHGTSGSLCDQCECHPGAAKQDDSALGVVLSPISPLTKEEQVNDDVSRASQVVPITPLIPAPSKGNKSGLVGVPMSSLIDDTNHDESVPKSDMPDSATRGGQISRADGNESSSAVLSLVESPEFEVSVNLQEKAREDGPAVDETTSNSTSPPVLTDLAANFNGVPQADKFNDYVGYSSPAFPVMETPLAPIGSFTDDKIPLRYKNTRFGPPIITDVTNYSSSPVAISGSDSEQPELSKILWRTGRTRPQDPGMLITSYRLILSAITSVALRSVLWIQRNSGDEPPVPEGRVRVRWKCHCGEHLYDDFVELRPGAASLLEALLNQRAPEKHVTPRATPRSSQSSFTYTPSSSAHPSSSGTSFSGTSGGFNTPSRPPLKDFRLDSVDETNPDHEIYPYQGLRYLLTCVNQARNTPKLSQVPLHKERILSDKDLALALRQEYVSNSRPWYWKLRLRGLTSIEFVQFYKHRNDFADIRKRPDVPPNNIEHDYEFDSSDLLPPVGPHYLVHLFRHPHEYDDERIAFHSLPKKKTKLSRGIGWGIQLIEGFLPERIWAFIIATLVLFGSIFALVWTIEEHDMQAGFGVASFVTALMALMFGFAQASCG